MDPLVALNDTGVALGGRSVLHDVCLELGPGEVIGISGQNGSGKTTLLRLVATLLTPGTGSGMVLGARLATPEVYGVRRRIGLMSHQPALITELTLAENLDHVLRIAGEDVARGRRALEVVGLGLAGARRVTDSSFGMKRRAEIARLLVTTPDLLLLDEAFSGLDSDAIVLIDALLDRVRAAGGGAIIVSHDARHLAGMADRLLTLSSGNLSRVT